MTVTVLPKAAAPSTVEAAPWYRTRLGLIGAQIAVGVFVVAFWAIAAHLDWLPPEILPTPSEVLFAFFELAGTPAFWLAFFQTVRAALTGLGLAILLSLIHI